MKQRPASWPRSSDKCTSNNHPRPQQIASNTRNMQSDCVEHVSPVSACPCRCSPTDSVCCPCPSSARKLEFEIQLSKSRVDLPFPPWLRFSFGLLLSLFASTLVPVGECGCRVQESRSCEAICNVNETTNVTDCVIRALVLLPLNNTYEASLGRVLPVFRVAEEKIRESHLLPPSIRFEWIPRDDQCDASYALVNAMDGILKNCSHVIFGPVCDYALASVGRITKYFNGQGTPLISVGGGTYDFQKSKTKCSDEYFMLLRAGFVSFQSLSKLTVRVMHKYNWKTAVLVHQRNGQMNVAGEDTCFLMMKSLAKELRGNNKTFTQYLLDSANVKNLTADLEREIGLHHSSKCAFDK